MLSIASMGGGGLEWFINAVAKYQDKRKDRMHGATGGLPGDETVIAFLPDPRVVGVRASWKYGN
jgi:hypothetical protein